MIPPSPLDLAHNRPVGPVPWPQFRDEISAMNFAWPKCSKKHACRFRQVCREMEALGVESTSDLNLAMVDLFIASKAWKSKFTLQNMLILVRTITHLAVHLHYLEVSPFTLKPISKYVKCGKPTGMRHLTRVQCRALLDQVAKEKAERHGWGRWKAYRLELAVNIALFTGMRKNELLRLQIQDVDLDARLIRLSPHNERSEFKTDASEDSVPIPEALAPLIDEWVRRWRLAVPHGFRLPDPVPPWLIPTCSRKAPWVSGSPQSRSIYQLKLVAGRAGIANANWHMLRRSLATHLEAKGVGGAMISRVLRHTSEKTTETYYRRRDEDNMKDALRDLTY
jgi:integrase